MERFYPDKYLAQVLPDGFKKKGLLFDNLNPRKTYLRALLQVAGRNGKELKSSVYETIHQYVKKEAELKAAGVEAFKEEAVNDQALLTQRIENFLVWNKVQEEKQAHKGQAYRWLPSDAKNPDPEHQLNYGKVFFEGDGQEMPGERYGCRCGIEWLEDSKQEAKVLEHTDKGLVNDIRHLYQKALLGEGLKDTSLDVNMGKISGKAVRKIQNRTGIDIKAFQHILKGENLRHGINRHAKDAFVPITADKVALIPHIVNNFDRVALEKRKNGNLRLAFTKKIKNTYTYIATVGKNKKQLLFKTFFGKK